jgi:uncharacterized protein involved in type VI secretion and phage assembly
MGVNGISDKSDISDTPEGQEPGASVPTLVDDDDISFNPDHQSYLLKSAAPMSIATSRDGPSFDGFQILSALLPKSIATRYYDRKQPGTERVTTRQTLVQTMLFFRQFDAKFDAESRGSVVQSF